MKKSEIMKRMAEIKSLLEFREHFNDVVTELVILTRGLEKKEDGIHYVPLWKWILKDPSETR